MSEQSCTRREFFVGAAKVVAVAGVATILTSQPADAAAAASVKSISVDLTAKPNTDLATVGKAIMVNNPNDKKNKIILYRKSATEVVAFDSKCSHVGGPVTLPNSKGEMTCEWHQATFNLEGAATKSPATKPLKKFVTKLSGNSVVITL